MRRFLQPPRKLPTFYIKDFPIHLTKETLKKARLVGQFLGIVLLTAFITYIFLSNITPFGITIHYTLQQGDKNISTLGPKNRVTVQMQNGQKIFHQTHDLVYFTTKMPFIFDEATVRIVFKNPNPDQTVSLGFQDQDIWHYATKSIDVPFLNDPSWNTTGTDPVLYQHAHTYKTVDDFLNKPPEDVLIGTFAYDNDFKPSMQQLENYQPASSNTVIDTPLRGKHTLYVYLHNEPFNMTIEKQDLNWYEDADTLSIKIYKDQSLVYQTTADDDGITDNSQQTLLPQDIVIKNPGPDLPENGIYKIVIDANTDTVIKKITTNLHKIVFAGSLFPAGNSNSYGPLFASSSATTVYTDALLLSATTYHNSGLQDILVGDQTVNVLGVKNVYPITPHEPITKVVIPKGDIILNGFQGYFAFNQDQFFRPTPYHTFPVTTKEDTDLVDYIVTDYLPSKKNGDWQIAERTFDIRSAFIKNGALNWIIMAPHLKENNHELLIDNIDIIFHKNPWLSYNF